MDDSARLEALQRAFEAIARVRPELTVGGGLAKASGGMPGVLLDGFPLRLAYGVRGPSVTARISAGRIEITGWVTRGQVNEQAMTEDEELQLEPRIYLGCRFPTNAELAEAVVGRMEGVLALLGEQ